LRAGTLDDESKKGLKPSVHLFTESKLDWVDLSAERERGVPVVKGMYKPREVWGKEALERFELVREKMRSAKKSSSL